MLITNLTNSDYWFGPMHLQAGNGQTLVIDDTSDTSIYLIDDDVADAVNTLNLSGMIQVTNANTPFPRPTGTPTVLHGDGSPNGLVYASQGSLFMRRDNSGATNSLYAKTSGVESNTGWSAVGASGIFPLGSTFPNSPAIGSACVIDTGQTFLTFVYDGTHWYSQPVPCALLPNGATPLTQTDAGPTTELVDGGLFAITDPIGAGCTVQLRIEGYFSNAWTGTPGDVSKIAHLEAGYRTAATNGTVGGITWLSGTVINTGNPNDQQFYYLASPWAAGPTSGDTIIPVAGGYRDGGGSGYTATYNAITIWLRFQK